MSAQKYNRFVETECLLTLGTEQVKKKKKKQKKQKRRSALAQWSCPGTVHIGECFQAERVID